MQQLLAFLYRFRIFGYFFFLELLCFWLLTSYNHYYNASFFNSSNSIAASVQLSRNQFNAYLSLQDVNRELAEENARLRKALADQILAQTIIDSTEQYTYIPSKIVNNEYRRSENYLTVNKGLKDGVSPGMGVISPTGVVGIVKSTSRYFSTVTSLLHQDLMISSELVNTKTLCTTQWNANSPLQSQLRFIPRHIPVRVGDSVVTSGYNSIFPQGILIGTIDAFTLKDESPFYEATINLASDFTSLNWVYIIQNQLKPEIDSLESLNE
jgi:rod shape-determining protein MreC